MKKTKRESNGIKIFLNAVKVTKSIPFEIRTENGYTKKFEKEVLEEIIEIEKEFKDGKRKGYSSFSEIITEIDTEIKAEKNV